MSGHPGGRLLALHGFNGSSIRKLSSGKLLEQLDTAELRSDAHAFSPDGAHVLLAASPKSLLWNVGALLKR